MTDHDEEPDSTHLPQRGVVPRWGLYGFGQGAMDGADHGSVCQLNSESTISRCPSKALMLQCV